MRRSLHSKLRLAIRLHFALLTLSFVSYLGFAVFLGPEFLVSDLAKKFRAVASDIIVVTATVLGPPAEPVVTATPLCVSGAPRITLDWADDTGTETWDIDRDSVPLVTGLMTSQYADTAVVANTSYTYIVTANGPMSPGVAVSDPVIATALDCSAVLPPLSVQAITFDKKDISTDRSGLRTAKRRPVITGTGNTQNAIIDITLSGPRPVLARTYANSTGYWTWKPPVKLTEGRYSIIITATDPSDLSRTGTDSFQFSVTEDNEIDGGKGKVDTDELLPQRAERLPLDFFVDAENKDDAVFQGSELFLSATAIGGAFPAGATIQAFLIGPDGKETVATPEETLRSGVDTWRASFTVPLHFTPGRYVARIDVGLLGGLWVSREAPVMLLPLPVVKLSSGEITYPEIAGMLGWLFLLLLLLAFLWLNVFVREYWLFLHSIRRVTERSLVRLGFFGSGGKGVSSR